ncbi:MAG TPA: 3-dehydroquinate synthase [Candidatus Acidoferrales bacterium]|nr:3-dehydroquinate synthase [Candidatus Acidoferrales bacterium]
MTQIDDLAYPIVVDTDVAPHLVAFAARRAPQRIVVLADRNVERRATALARALRKGTKAQVSSHAFALGERRKTMRTVGLVLDALAELGADRTTLVVGVGGGVAGDLFGFAAGIYMRGVPFINVATSLVAMVDAAVGGKTGVDLPAGKNLAGVFRDPLAVFCDIGSLQTLPERHLREGLAELVKHGIIEGSEAFESLEVLAPHPLRKWPWESVVSASIKVKTMVVSDDRLEAGAREVLNLGHTFGHAIERVSDYRVSHGDAIAMGLRGAGLLALRTGRFSPEEHLRVLSLLSLLRLPLIAPFSEVDPIIEAMAADKKTRNGTLRFVLPRTIGDVEYGITVPGRTLRAVLQRLREVPGAREFR